MVILLKYLLQPEKLDEEIPTGVEETTDGKRNRYNNAKKIQRFENILSPVITESLDDLVGQMGCWHGVGILS